MSNPSRHSYNAVIEYTLHSALQLAKQTKPHNSISGFCQLLGPTGGGKSTSLVRRDQENDIPASLEIIRQFGLQSILVTHRWNILIDIYHKASACKDSHGNSFQISILYAQSENVISAITRSPLRHESDLKPMDLPDPYVAIEELDTANLFEGQEKKELIAACRAISNSNQSLKNNSALSPKLQKFQEQECNKTCSSIEHKLLRIMTRLQKYIKEYKKKYGDNHPLTRQAITQLESYRKHPWLRRIFPAIAWHDDKQHLLIMTTHKLFSSFYDGQQKVRMSSDALSGHVIFIDEFDYQSDILQSLLAQDQLVQEPPECIGQLLAGGRQLLARIKSVKSAPVPEIYQKLNALIKSLQAELTEKGIDLSGSRTLVIPPEEDTEQGINTNPFTSKYLFRSDHLITSEPIKLQQKKHGFEVSNADQHHQSNLNIGDFLRTLEKYIRYFSLLLSELSNNESEAHDYLVRLSHLIFDPPNDHRPSHYSSTLPGISLYSLPRTSLVELNNVRKSNLLPNSHACIYGLTTWLLKANETDADIDPLRIQIRRALMPTTPEGLLVSLASRNLVFGLSATSYLERALGHFDLRWVESALRYIAEARNPDIQKSFLGDPFINRPKNWFKKPIPYLQSHEDQQAQNDLIKSIVKKKASVRKTRLNAFTHHFNDLINTDDFLEIVQSLPPDFFNNENDDECSEFAKNYRSEMLRKLLYVIKLSSCRKQHKGHLIFVNSIRFLRKWLLEESASTSRNLLSWLKKDQTFTDKLDKTNPLLGFTDIFIPIEVNQTKMLLCLLNAAGQKRIGFEKAYQAAFDTGRPVIVVTQTASSTNGINLDYYLPTLRKQMDLTCLYILENQHFYFSSTQTDGNDSEMSHAGFQLRNLEKLLRAGEISRKQHHSYIMPIMTNNAKPISQLNIFYKRTEDYLKNAAADVQQQVGRIERTWAYVPEVEIHLCNHVAKSLYRFALLPAYTNNRHLISDLNQQLLESLIHKAETRQIDWLSLMMTKSQPGSDAVDIIDHQLIPALRKARTDASEFKLIAPLWRDLGQAILQHDLSWQPKKKCYGIVGKIREWACFERPGKSLETEEIWYAPDTWQFFPEHADGRRRYNPQKLYSPIQHPAINNWFNQRGYRTSLYPHASELEQRYALHPLVVQRILQGRLGEEAIRALLFSEGIVTRQSIDDHRLLELYDFSIPSSRFRVDAKYWFPGTQSATDNDYQAWLEGGKPPDKTPLKLSEKIDTIRSIEGNHTILIIANLITADSDCSLKGFNQSLERISVERADILFIPGCLNPNQEMTSAFKWLAKLIQAEIKE